MNRYIISIAIVLFSFTAVFSQSFPVKADYPVWKVRHGLIDTIQVEQDTFFCNYQWNIAKLKREGDSMSENFAYYRVEGKKVYIKENNDCALPAVLMYDFSLEQGDSTYCGYKSASYQTDSALFWVDTVAYADFFGIERKVIIGHFEINNSNFTTFWLEGVGDIFHPFYSLFAYDYSTLMNLYNGDQIIFCNVNSSSDCSLKKYYVDKNVEGGSGDGNNWTNAMVDLQEAIDAATLGDTIWVASGTYLPTMDNDRTKHFELKQGVVILGGFAGFETTEEQRNWQMNSTVLSGDIGISEDSTDNSYNIVYTIGTDSTSVLDGFIIRDGYAIHENNSYFGIWVRGGGLLVDTDENNPVSKPCIKNCQFLNNTGKYGGAICYNGSTEYCATPLLENCFFYNNRGSIQGGGILKIGEACGNTSVIMNCSFENNWAWQGGGAVYLFDACSAHFFKGCSFKQNEATSGAGGIYYQSSCEEGNVKLINCSFEENIGHPGGGFAFLYTGFSLNNDDKYFFEIEDCFFYKNDGYLASGGALAFASADNNVTEINIKNSTFRQNTAGEGGAIDIYINKFCSTSLTIDKCLFDGNTSTSTPFYGGIRIIFDLFGDSLSYYSSITNSVFVNNKGAMGSLEGNNGHAMTEIKNCTFFNNGIFPISKNWGLGDSQMNISNSILWETGATTEDIVSNVFFTEEPLFGYSLDHCLISSDMSILPNTTNVFGEGMIYEVYPQFLDTTASNFGLSACSPAINKGDNLVAEELLSGGDILEENRLLDSIIDMGAYEQLTYKVEVTDIGDISCNGQNNGSVTFLNTGNTPFSYNWYNGIHFGNGASALSSGEYNFSVTDVFGCSDTINDILISEPSILTANYAINNASNSTMEDGDISLLNIEGGISPYVFSWNTGSTDSSLFNIASDWYTVTIADSNQCIINYSFFVDFTDGVKDLKEKNWLNIYPNPSKGKIFIELEEELANILNFKIVNSFGKVIYERSGLSINFIQKEINLLNQPNGFYVILLESEKGIIFTKPFMIITED